MTLKTKTILSLICNTTTAVVTTAIVIFRMFVKSDILEYTWQTFMFFTTDCNILAAVASVLVCICDVKILQGKRTTVARPFTLIKYAATVGLTLTFFTVLVLLVPLYGVEMEWAGTGFHMHVAAPALTFISFMFFEQHTRLSMRDTLWGMAPIVIYAVMYFSQTVLFKNWYDFYAFNAGGRWYLIAPLFLGISYGFCAVIRILRNRITYKNNG